MTFKGFIAADLLVGHASLIRGLQANNVVTSTPCLPFHNRVARQAPLLTWRGSASIKPLDQCTQAQHPLVVQPSLLVVR